MKKNIKNYAAMLMMAVAVMGGMTSCEEHTDEFDGSLRVGNILLADNSVVSPQGYDADGQQAVGVIFYCNRDTAAWIVTAVLCAVQRTRQPCWYRRFPLLQPRLWPISVRLWQAGLCRRQES